MAVNIEKRNNRQNNWLKENKERINFLMEPGTRARIEAAAANEGIKASEFIRRAIEERISIFNPADPEDQKPKN